MDQKQNHAQNLDKTIVDCREHVLYTGVTLTGKTTLARHHARILKRAKYDIAVYDPVRTATAGGDWPEDAVIIQDPETLSKFIDKAKGTDKHPLFLFVDESADIFSHGEIQNHWIPRRIRHEHIYLRMIAQRPKMLHPDVRSQCSYVYMLRLAQDDQKTVLSDFGHNLHDIDEEPLDKGDCLLLTSGSTEIERFNVFELVDRKRQSTTPKAA